jgi:phosphomannomutase
LTLEPIISVSGLRGIVGHSLTPDVAMRYVAAFVEESGAGPIVLSRDGRATGPMLATLLRGVLLALGRDVIDADVAATPTTGVLVRQLQAAGGVQISASHNPPEYNGIKLFGPEGRVISEGAGQAVLTRYRGGGPPRWAPHDRMGRLQADVDTLEHHAALVRATVDVGAIRARRFRVLLDSNHGAGSLLGKHLLQQLGCQVIPLGDTPDGQFEHPPEPLAENLADVCDRLRQEHVDVGFCQDPDADRLALIDENGRYVGEEYTLALCVAHVLASGNRRGPIVTNCSTSRMSQDLAEQYGVPFFHAKVGEANVTARMIEKQAIFGGEGNGGPIDPRVGYVRDSFVGMALVLDALARSKRPLSAWVDELPRYAIHKSKVAIDPDRPVADASRLESHFPDARPSRLDGLRLDWPDRWLLVRGSNTEPIVRLIAEAREPQIAEELCREAERVLRA